MYARRKKLPEHRYIKIQWQPLCSIFLIILMLLFATYSLTLFTSLLFKLADSKATADFGKILFIVDEKLFSTNPGVYLINRFGGTFVESLLLWVYNSIFWVISLVLVFALFFNKGAFRRLFLAFFISWMIAFPIWFLYPALPPDLMFRLDKLGMASPKDRASFNDFTPSPLLKENLESQEKIHIINLDQNPNLRSLPTSTFPSMHAAWGIIVAYAGLVLWPWLGLLLIPWSLLNGVGAVYILEHFSLDIFLGYAIAIIAIIVTEILLRFESKYLEDKFGFLSGFDYIHSSLKKLFDWSGLQDVFLQGINSVKEMIVLVKNKVP